ncbi:MAG: hypothetical protein ACR2N6_06125, partial [Miltoncostaeaceae bacterium]
SVRAATGTATYASNASFRYRARIGRVRVRFDFPASRRSGKLDPVVSGGTNPRFGVLQGVSAQVATQRGTITHNGGVCTFRPTVPRDERELNVDFNRTANGNPRFVYPVVRGPNALVRLGEEIPFFDRNVCNARSDVTTVSPPKSKGFEEWEWIRYPRKKLRKAFRGKRTKVVLRGTTRTPVQVVPNRAGSVVVTTRITMRLVASR